MEEFIVLFISAPDFPKEGDYYFNESKNEITQVVTFPEIGIKEDLFKNYKKMVPMLCSEYYYVGDKVLYKDQTSYLFGVVEEIYHDREKVVMQTANGKELIDDTSCFYPILEIFSKGPTKIYNEQILTRDEIEIKTVCPRCHRSPRKTKICTVSEDHCERSNPKEYAYITK